MFCCGKNPPSGPASPRDVLQFAYGQADLSSFLDFPFRSLRIQGKGQPLNNAYSPPPPPPSAEWRPLLGTPALPPLWPKVDNASRSQLRPIVAKKRNADCFTKTKALPKYCPFCEKNGETEVVYRSHNLRERATGVTCPILSKFKCPHCDATGRFAHTESHCPTRPTNLGPSLCRPDVVRNSIGKIVVKRPRK